MRRHGDRRRVGWLWALVIVVLATAVAPSVVGEELLEAATGSDRHEDISAAAAPIPSSVHRPSPSPTRAPTKRRMLLGHSVLGRPIWAMELGDPSRSHKLLVVGCIHGDECAGIAIARRLEALPPPSSMDLWVVPDLNPDGFAARTRQNARGVDLNRNFPFGWRRLGAPGDPEYSGPRPLSEPESRIAHSLILRVHPTITVWFHQALGIVDESGGSIAVERRYARLVGLPLRGLLRYPGSVATWENHRLRGTTSFVVELPAGSLSAAAVRRYAKALLELFSSR